MFYCSFLVVKSPVPNDGVHSSSSSDILSPSPSPSPPHDTEPSVFIEDTLKTNTKNTPGDYGGECDVDLCVSTLWLGTCNCNNFLECMHMAAPCAYLPPADKHGCVHVMLFTTLN